MKTKRYCCVSVHVTGPKGHSVTYSDIVGLKFGETLSSFLITFRLSKGGLVMGTHVCVCPETWLTLDWTKRKSVLSRVLPGFR